MRFNHLPVAGGLYDQHPRLIEDWGYIFERRALREQEEAEKRERASKKYRKR